MKKNIYIKKRYIKRKNFIIKDKDIYNKKTMIIWNRKKVE